MEAARAASICSIARPAPPDRRTRCFDEAPRECRAAEFINPVGKETYRSRAFANVAGKLPQNLVLGATRERPMLFRVGRTFAVVFCVGVVAIEFAAAADLPYLPGPAPAYVPPSWAGFYLGGQVGYGMDSVRWRNLGGSAVFSPPDFGTRGRGSGVIGGGQLGYNFQYNPLVLRIEGSVSAADFDRSFASPYFPATECGPHNSIDNAYDSDLSDVLPIFLPYFVRALGEPAW